MNELIESKKRILLTGGAGFIGGSLIRKLLLETNSVIFNIDKLGYASDFKQVEQLFEKSPDLQERYFFYKLNLAVDNELDDLVNQIKPDFIFHLAAESHVDRSIEGPKIFLESNILGTFNLLEAVRKYWEKLSSTKKDHFCFQHISTDEVFGSLGDEGLFSEKTAYSPRSPYAASKASSDHFVQAWHHTYGLPIVITNCSNNFGPWQYPEKLIPVAILKGLRSEIIPMYGNGINVRDWLFIEDHLNALLLVASKGKRGKSYCIGGYGQKTNHEVLQLICTYMDQIKPINFSYKDLIRSVDDRPGHDYRYAIDSSLITKELGWKPLYAFEDSLYLTVKWYTDNLHWAKSVKN